MKRWKSRIKLEDYLNLKLLQHAPSKHNVVLIKTWTILPGKANKKAMDRITSFPFVFGGKKVIHLNIYLKTRQIYLQTLHLSTNYFYAKKQMWNIFYDYKIISEY